MKIRFSLKKVKELLNLNEGENNVGKAVIAVLNNIKSVKKSNIGLYRKVKFVKDLEDIRDKASEDKSMLIDR